MKAKYKSGHNTSNVSRLGEHRNRHKSSQRGSGQIDPDLSDNQNPDPAINEDISQFLNTKQTGFNLQSVSGTDNENVLERESQFRVTGKDGGFQLQKEKDGLFIHEINTGQFPQIYGSGALIFNA